MTHGAASWIAWLLGLEDKDGEGVCRQVSNALSLALVQPHLLLDCWGSLTPSNEICSFHSPADRALAQQILTPPPPLGRHHAREALGTKDPVPGFHELTVFPRCQESSSSASNPRSHRDADNCRILSSKQPFTTPMVSFTPITMSTSALSPSLPTWLWTLWVSPNTLVLRLYPKQALDEWALRAGTLGAFLCSRLSDLWRRSEKTSKGLCCSRVLCLVRVGNAPCGKAGRDVEGLTGFCNAWAMCWMLSHLH